MQQGYQYVVADYLCRERGAGEALLLGSLQAQAQHASYGRLDDDAVAEDAAQQS